MSKEGTTIGIWVDEGSDLVERFDRTFNKGEGVYSRSKAVKDAMEMAIEIENGLHRVGFEAMEGRDRRAWVKQALIDQARRERLEDE